MIDICKSVEPEDIASIDLRNEALAAVASGDPVEAYRLKWEPGGQRGDLIWFPSIKRGGIATGGDASWSDADSPEDLVRRYESDDMRP